MYKKKKNEKKSLAKKKKKTKTNPLRKKKKKRDSPVVVAVIVRCQKPAAVVIVPVFPGRKEKQHPDQVHEHSAKRQDDVQPPRCNMGRVYQPGDGVKDYLHA